MPDDAPAVQSTALTVVERSEAALRAAARRIELAELATKSAGITTITNTAGYQECHAARMVLKNTRVEIEKQAKAAREDATAFTKAVIVVEKELVAIIEPEEKRLQAIQDAHDEKVEAEKAEKQRLEQERVAGINQRIDWIRAQIVEFVGKPATEIAAMLDDLSGLPMDEENYGEFLSVAQTALATTTGKLQEMHAAAVANEQEAARLAEERAELERQREAQQRRDDEARQQREEQERLDREARERTEAEAREQRQREDAERQRVAGIKDKVAEIAAAASAEYADSAAIQAAIDRLLNPLPTHDTFAEFTPDADAATVRAVSTLRERLESRVAHEQRERERQEAADRDAEARRQAEAKDAAERDEKAQLEKQEERRRALAGAKQPTARDALQQILFIVRSRDDYTDAEARAASDLIAEANLDAPSRPRKFKASAEASA